MKSGLKYIAFNHHKSINELLYSISLWITEFEFIKIELSFLKHLIKTYRFKFRIPNLSKHSQLIMLKLNSLKEAIFNYLEGYKKLKTKIFQYISGLIK